MTELVVVVTVMIEVDVFLQYRMSNNQEPSLQRLEANLGRRNGSTPRASGIH